MSGVRYVWAVEPAPDVGWAEQGLWVQHALRSSKRFQDAAGAGTGLIWRRARGPALCGARPPDGVWSSIGNGWDPATRRRVVRTIRAQGFGPGEAPAVVCPTCERLAAGLDPGRDPW